MCVLGLVLPYVALVRWVLAQDRFSFESLWNDISVNGLSGMAWLDVLITAVVLLAFMRSEGRRMNMGGLTLPMLGTYLVGPSFGLPLFLLMRERARYS